MLPCTGWVAQLVGASSHTPKGCGFNSWSGYLGCALDPWSGHIQEATYWCFSLISVFLFLSLSIFSLSLPLSLKSINISLGEDYGKKTNSQLSHASKQSMYYTHLKFKEIPNRSFREDLVLQFTLAITVPCDAQQRSLHPVPRRP